MSKSGRNPDGYIVELSGRSGDYSDQNRTERSSCTFHNVKQGETYDITVKCVFGEITIGGAATMLKVSAGTQAPTVKPDAPQKLNVIVGRTVKVLWNEVTNTHIACYELRTNADAGKPEGLLLQTKDIQASVELQKRKGTLYLFAKNRIGQYSDSAKIDYEKAVPRAPKWLNVAGKMGAVAITTEAVPNDCIGVVAKFKGVSTPERTVKSESPDMMVAAEPDVYTVKVAFYDQFGEGAESAPQDVAVKAKIDKADIENLTIAEKDLDAALAERMQDVQTTKESVSSIVAKLSGNPQESGYSAITQIYNGLQLKVNQGDIISAINVAPGGVKIDGRLLHITGNTIIDGNVIVNHMLQAGAITADKLAVDSLSAISAKIGKLRTKDTGARTEISDNLIEVFDEGEKTRVRIGIFE